MNYLPPDRKVTFHFPESTSNSHPVGSTNAAILPCFAIKVKGRSVLHQKGVNFHLGRNLLSSFWQRRGVQVGGGGRYSELLEVNT